MYKLYTNEGEFFVRHCPTQADMYAYMRQKMDEGMKIKDIMFTWGPVRVYQNARNALGGERFAERKG